MTDEKKGKTGLKIKELQILTDNLFERFDELDERVDGLEYSQRELTSWEKRLKV